MTEPIPVTRNTAPVTFVLTDLVPTVTGEKMVLAGQPSVTTLAYLSRKVGAKRW